MRVTRIWLLAALLLCSNLAVLTSCSNDDNTVVSPADSWPKELWKIGDDNQLEYPQDLQIKTAKLADIGALIGEGSAYEQTFVGGTLTHTFLDVNDYHRYHAPAHGRGLRTTKQISE
jgi:phosphatidylserine decarboxylase